MAEKGNKANTVGIIEAIVTPVLEAQGLRLWDVRFEKEGPDWFLRVFIDRDEPLDIIAVEAATRAIDPLIDAANPIEPSYFMEVGSPGLGRRLTKDMHFEAKCGEKVLAHLVRPNEVGEKEIEGILEGKDGNIVTLKREDGTQVALDATAVSWFKLCDDENLFADF